MHVILVAKVKSLYVLNNGSGLADIGSMHVKELSILGFRVEATVLHYV